MHLMDINRVGVLLKIEKISLNSLKESEIIKFTSDRLQENLDKSFEWYDEIFLITNNSKECGFFYLKQNNSRLILKFFLKHDIPNFGELKNFLKQEFQESEIKYVVISLHEKSQNVFNNFKSIDTVLRYERKQNLKIKIDKLPLDFVINNIVNDYDELARFLEIVFNKDEDYCKSNWKKIIELYTNSDLPKIEILIENNDEIIGSIIGLKSTQNKYYIHTIGVSPDYRGKKIGKKLMYKFLQQTNNSTTYLSVFDSAEIARRLYEAFGFKIQKTLSIYCRIKDL